MSIAYYLAQECDTCGEDMHHGLVLNLHPDYLGHPVIYCDTVSQIKFECEHCGGVTYTGDFDDMCEHEEGEIPEDEDEDDEDSEEDEPEAGDE